MGWCPDGIRRVRAHARRLGTAGAAVVVAPCTHAAIALLGAGAAPVRATGAERALVAGASVRRTAELAAREVADDYRRALLQALVERALERVVR